MESAVDMTASSLESADLRLVQLHGMHLHQYDPPKRCHAPAFEPRYLCVCVHVERMRWSDRRCLSQSSLHKMRMQLVEEDHVHCANRDNSDLMSLQADSLCILVGKPLPPPPHTQITLSDCKSVPLVESWHDFESLNGCLLLSDEWDNTLEGGQSLLYFNQTACCYETLLLLNYDDLTGM